MHAGAPVPDRDPARPVGSSPRRRWPSVATLVVVVAALGLAALGLRWRSSVRLTGARPDADLVTSGILAILVIGALIAVPVAVLASRGGQGKPRRTSSWRDVLVRIAVLALVVVVASRFDLSRPKPEPTADTSAAPSRAPAGAEAVGQGWSWASGLALTVLVLAIALAVGVAAQRARGAGRPASADRAGQQPTTGSIAQAAKAARQALDLGNNDRAAVIASYTAMQQSFSQQGVPLPASDTTADLLERAQSLGIVPGPAAGRLAALYRQARFSTDPLPPNAGDLARSALDAIEAAAPAVGHHR